ncbi:Aminopeptidase 2 mitochondrial [Podila verticillata]|nr:Aminopeptidase 2 mitochondrial [Podila verticillata]
MTAKPRPSISLERTIIPIHYNLKIVPCPVNVSFLGEVSIEICIAEPTYGITLNAKELNIQTATARDHLSTSGYSVTATSVSYNVEEETITLEFPTVLHVATSWILDIAYIGLVNERLNGFYRSVYTDADNNIHQLTTTQFQSTHARRAFPCWDEPAVKATFTLTLVAPMGMTCLSNMSVDTTTLLENRMQEVTFLKTPIMATYLLAWTIGDLDYIEAYSSGEFNGEPVQCRLYAPVGLAIHGRYSLDLAVKSVEYFARLFNIPYPLPKLDLVAVPDFAPGAMENWGLISFRTYAVLIEEFSSHDRKLEIAATVIHEISHQWFGNLVTMDWWSDLWLFEGFATHLAYIAVDELFPEWDIWSEFVKRIQEVLKHDSLRTSHPVEVGVENPCEITQIFDEVSYMKGASVLRMLSVWLGQDKFLQGIRKFMLKFMWGNANTDDLWQTLAEECHVDVPGFMQKWTRQTGYPVLSITELDESTILVRQNLFLSTGDVREEEDCLIWPVPLSLITADEPVARNIMMDSKDMVLKVDTNKWYKFNMGQAGFYRVSYPSKSLDLLGKTFGAQRLNGTADVTIRTRPGPLDSADRVGLLTDAAALVASGNAATSSFLTLLKYFEDEEDYMVWGEVSLRLQELLSVWLEQPASVINALKEVQRRLFTKIVKRLGWDYAEGEDPSSGHLRALAIRFAGRAGDPDIVAEARKRFGAFMANKDMSAIPPDLRFPVFEIVLRTTVGTEEYEAVVSYYRETFIPGEKLVALTVLGYANSQELVRRTLAFAMSPEVRTQDILTAIATLRSSMMGRAELWDFMRLHWDVLYNRHCDDLRFLDYFVILSIGSFSSLERYREVQAFFSTKDTSSYERILATCLEGIRKNILWLERDRQDVASWLRVNGYLTKDLCLRPGGDMLVETSFGHLSHADRIRQQQHFYNASSGIHQAHYANTSGVAQSIHGSSTTNTANSSRSSSFSSSPAPSPRRVRSGSSPGGCHHHCHHSPSPPSSFEDEQVQLLLRQQRQQHEQQHKLEEQQHQLRQHQYQQQQQQQRPHAPQEQLMVQLQQQLWQEQRFKLHHLQLLERQEQHQQLREQEERLQKKNHEQEQRALENGMELLRVSEREL